MHINLKGLTRIRSATAGGSERELEWTCFHKVSKTLERPAVGCIVWLGDSFIAKLLVHGKPSEVNATAFDALLAVQLETVAVEERSCGKTGKSGNPRGANRV